MATQSGWRFCKKCNGLFFGANQAQSHCPAGGTHDQSASGNYFVQFGDNAINAQPQGGWRFCQKCAGLFFGGTNPTTSRTCPAGGLHDNSGRGHYMMELGEDGPGLQGNWRFCLHCFGLFFSAPSGSGFNFPNGLCSAEGANLIHDHSTSGRYHLVFGPVPVAPAIHIFQSRNQEGGTLEIDGSGFNPGVTAEIVISNVPNRTANFVRFASVGGNGSFRFSENFRCTSQNVNDAFGVVSVTATDPSTKGVANGATSAGLWVCSGF